MGRCLGIDIVVTGCHLPASRRGDLASILLERPLLRRDDLVIAFFATRIPEGIETPLAGRLRYCRTRDTDLLCKLGPCFKFFVRVGMLVALVVHC